MQATKKDLNHILIETTIRKTLRDITVSPETSIRNIVDLALHFSTGGFQKNFFKTAQTMLQNNRSSYYGLIKDIVSNVNHDTLTSFGINIGYNSCTKGAKVIRQIKEEQNFNIPWSLTLSMTEKNLPQHRQVYASLIRQGKNLGIYTYLLFTSGNLLDLSLLIKENTDCAFILFAKPEQITDEILIKIQPLHNIMISVCAGKRASSICRKLRQKSFLYSIFFKYTEKNRNSILNSKWLSSLLPLHPAFTFLLSDRYCTEKTQKEIYDFVVDIRKKQEHSTFLMDLKYDSMLIDSIISAPVCSASFDRYGQLRALSGITENRSLNIFHNDLNSIFKTVFV